MLRITRPCEDNKFTRRIRGKLLISVSIVRFLYESCIEVGIVALSALKMISKDQFNYFQDAMCVVLAGITVCGLIFTPIYLNYVGKRLVNTPLYLT